MVLLSSTFAAETKNLENLTVRQDCKNRSPASVVERLQFEKVFQKPVDWNATVEIIFPAR